MTPRQLRMVMLYLPINPVAIFSYFCGFAYMHVSLSSFRAILIILIDFRLYSIVCIYCVLIILFHIPSLLKKNWFAAILFD